MTRGVSVAKGLGTWSVIAGTKRRKGRGSWFLRTDLKYCQVE